VSQRININYSIKLEHLSLELQRLYKNILDDLEATGTTHSIPSDLLSLNALEEIEGIKDFVVDLHYRLTDVENIIKTYLQFMAAPETKESNTQIEFEQLSNLREKLLDMTKNLGMDNEVSD